MPVSSGSVLAHHVQELLVVNNPISILVTLSNHVFQNLMVHLVFGLGEDLVQLVEGNLTILIDVHHPKHHFDVFLLLEKSLFHTTGYELGIVDCP